MKSLFTDKTLIKMRGGQKTGESLNLKSIDKFKIEFIKDFMENKIKNIEVVLSNSDKPITLDIMEFDIFNITSQWSWVDIKGIISGDKKVLATIETYLNDKVLAYAFKPESSLSIISAIIDKINMQLLKDGLHDEVVIINISYGGLVIYSNDIVGGR